MNTENTDIYKKTRAIFIITAALQHFISTFIGTTYITKLAMNLGIDNATIGVLSIGIELGNLFQILALFLSKIKTRKQIIIVCTAGSSLLYATLYFFPVAKLEGAILSTLFVAMIFSAALLYGMVAPLKSSWTASTLQDGKRGVFYSLNEAISLISGIVISIAASTVIDTLEAAGKIKTSFLVIGITMIVICTTQAVLLMLAREPEIDYGSEKLSKKLAIALGDKNLLRLLPFFALLAMAYGGAIPFYSTYALGPLGFSMTFMTVLSTVSSIVRASISVPFGRFADRHSFVSSMTLSVSLLIAAVGVNVFTNPKNAFILYPIYTVIFAVSLAGYFTGQVNLVLDYTKPASRTESLAIYTTVYGVFTLISTNLMRPLIEYVEKTGSFLFFRNVYPQQVLSAISVVIAALALLYLRLVISKAPKPQKTGV